jgi:quercetin dioxygenase-like cupin family protein
MRVPLLSCSFLLVAVAVSAQAKASAKPAALIWGPAPAAFPAGAKMAVVSGDPGKAEPFTVELALPDGYRIAPHFHPTEESVVVKKGTFLVGMGDTLDLAKTKAMKPGATGTIPAQAHHFAATKGATELSVSAMGPFAMTYVNQADDPRGSAHQ